MPVYLPYTPEAPPEAVRRLKQIDPNLNLKFVEFPSPDDDRDGPRWWALALDWEEHDPRRAMIARGELGNAPFDILGYLPLDCGAHEAYGYVENCLLAHKTRPDVGAMVARLGQWNANQSDVNLAPTLELAQELIETNAKTMFEKEGKRIPKVFQSGKR